MSDHVLSSAQLPSPLDLDNRRFICRSPGIAATTKVWSKPEHGGVTLRVGIAIMGNCDDDNLEECGHNPYHPLFRDNFVEVNAATVDIAIEALGKEMSKMSEGLWE